MTNAAVGCALVVLALVGGCAPAPAAPSAERVDVLDYVVGSAGWWPRLGNQLQHQGVDYDRQEVCWAKHGNPRFFECWRWDDAFFYHVVDHGVDGDTGESYRFVDGRWMPRMIPLDTEWRLDIDTRIVWFDAACGVNAARSGSFRYHQRVWREAARDAGGDIGVRDTLVLEYTPEDPAGGPPAPELFYFARGAGWYEWRRGANRVVFNRLGGPFVAIARSIVCR